MKLAVCYSRARRGLNAPEVSIEAHVSSGISKFNIVGLPETSVRESRERVRSAILHNGFQFPWGRLTVNLAPADLPKSGSCFDLPIALSILAATGQIEGNTLGQYEFIGELALAGELRKVGAVLPAVLASRQNGRTIVLPTANAAEAALVPQARLLMASHLVEVCQHLAGTAKLQKPEVAVTAANAGSKDLAEVHGQKVARRALEIAAAAGHNLLMIGVPGIGKTMLAERLPTILPPMTEDEALECAAIQSVSTSGFTPRMWKRRPFRSPHHSLSMPALIGGGRDPHPGEVSLAHHGVLFLDELPEFNRCSLEALREPLESGQVRISRVAAQAEFPAEFQLVAAMNPCPCGYLGDQAKQCKCVPDKVHKYRQRISGPLLDRLDMHIILTRPAVGEMLAVGKEESSAAVRARVMVARGVQQQRAGKLNSQLQQAELEQFAPIDRQARETIAICIKRLALSARGVLRLRRLARTVADLDQSQAIQPQHIAEASSYRQMDRSHVA
ncbi:MAG: YifB family Mg chelatase-like AAA ATPase [Candidatus Porifericomitaceae bacterium WSBS_2022_MAG_OTU9]